MGRRFKVLQGGITMLKGSFKPIQATPELRGNDAMKFVDQVFKKPNKELIERNKNASNILDKIMK